VGYLTHLAISPWRQAALCVGKLTESYEIARPQTCDARHASYRGANLLATQMVQRAMMGGPPAARGLGARFTALHY